MKRKTKRKLQRSRRRYRNRHNRNKPVNAYFPLTCSECGFTANGPNEIENHEHDNECFNRNE